MDEKLRKIIISKIKRYVLLTAIIVAIALAGFTYFKIYVGGRTAFREAKNIRIALSMLSVEYYGKGNSVYDPVRTNGLAEGVKERLRQVIETDGATTILSYDYNEKEVTSFVYETGNYRVFYIEGKDKTKWTVRYCIPIMNYEE